MDKPKILIPAIIGDLAATGCAVAMVAWIDAFHADLWPGGFTGKILLPGAIPLILFGSVVFGFPGGGFMAFIASHAFEVTSFMWSAPVSTFIGAASGIALVYVPALGHWPGRFVFGDLFILVAALSIAVGGAVCAFLLARSCRALRPKSA